MKYYNIFVDGTNDLFTYCDENDEYNIGERVLVSFRNKKSTGVIVEEDFSENRDFKVLNIIKKVENAISLDKNFLKLLLWVKNYYLCSYDNIFTMAIPNDLSIKYKKIYIVKDVCKIIENTEISEETKDFFLKKVGVSKATTRKYLDKEKLKKYLEENILIEIENKIFYNTSNENLEGYFEIEEIGYFKSKLEINFDTIEKNIKKKDIEILKREEIIIWDKKVEDFVLKSEKVEEKYVNNSDKILNEEQLKVKESILESEKQFFLLKGVTGSGKTEVYLSLIKEAYRKGKGSIFLVPEISLTPQMIARFKDEFKENIAILHSKLKNEERAREWLDVYLGKKKIVLGVRSAIFAPVKNLEYIIVDEEHETTYKQDTNPRYNAKQVAIRKSQIEGAKLILGSATPSVESYYYAKQGLFQLLELNNRYNNANLPDIEIIDMKKENSLYFSEKLLEEIRKRLIKKEQVLLLLNRKGYSTYIQCKECGYVEECSDCSIKYSYYASQNILKCNYCGKIKRYNGKCSKCGSTKIIHSGKGIERVEEEIKKLYNVSVIRVDSDSSKDRDFFEKMYHSFLEGKYDIMIGTQLISKGLHFPNVTLVGIINSDTILNFPDFRAGEKTFQLATQTAGRSGRGEKKGLVFIQTYQSENKLFENIKNSDYESFYQEEIRIRELLEYPPFSKIINIGISSLDERYLMEIVKEIKTDILDSSVDIYGPMPCLVYKVRNRYRYNILIKGKHKNIDNFKKNLKNKLKKYEKNSKIIIAIDVDPINMI